MGPYFEKLSAEYPDVTFLKVDVDDVTDAASNAGITSIPQFHFYKDGKQVCSSVDCVIGEWK